MSSAAASAREKLRRAVQKVRACKRLSDKQFSKANWQEVLEIIGASKEDAIAFGAMLEADPSGNVGMESLMHGLYGSEEPASSSSAATLRVIQITDVYMLENFPHLKTLIETKAKELELQTGGAGKSGSKTISMLTGDFLAPYLLSSIDRGQGMMRMLNETPIDYLTWGNHEADLSHEDVMLRCEEYKGKWINSNMQSHESFGRCDSQIDSEVLEVRSADGSNVRKVGMVAVLSDEPNLYKPGAFGGATLEDPWKTLAKYKTKLEKENGCDLVLPLCHLYEVQDERTAREFDFPVILSGHDHHIVDRVVDGSRILKPGADAHHAICLDISWESAGDSTPTVVAQLLKVADFSPVPRLVELVHEINSTLDHLRYTQVAQVPVHYRPLSSANSRGCCTSCARYLCSAVRDSLNLHCLDETPHCDCVLINGGNFRGERNYKEDEHLTLQDLMSEIDEKVEIVISVIPGHVIRIGLQETWKSISGAWMQYDDGLKVDKDGFVTEIASEPIDPDRNYRVGTTKRFGVILIPSVAKYFKEEPWRVPNPDTGIPVHALLLHFFAESAWMLLWAALDVDGNGTLDKDELRVLDRNGSGSLDRKEILEGLSRVTHFSTFKGEFTLADLIMKVAGHNELGGELTLKEINQRRRQRRRDLKRAKHRATMGAQTQKTIQSLCPDMVVSDNQNNQKV